MHMVHVNKLTKKPTAVIAIMFDVQEGGNTANKFISDLNPEMSKDPIALTFTSS